MLRKAEHGNHSMGKTATKEEGGCSVKWMVLGLLAAAFVLFSISSVYEAFEAAPEAAAMPAPRGQQAPAVSSGEMVLTG